MMNVGGCKAMTFSLKTFRKSILMAWALASAWVGHVEAAGPSEPEISHFHELVGKLDSDSYFERLTAYDQVAAYSNVKVVGWIEEAIGRSSPECSEKLVRILGAWANDPHSDVGRASWDALEKIGRNKISSRSQLANLLTRSISVNQSDLVEDRLSKLSVSIDNRSVQVLMQKSNGETVFRVDDGFRGDERDLAQAKWLYTPQIVQLDGKRVTRKWLEAVLQMQNLRILQLRHTSLTMDDLELIRQCDSLDTLEILYMPIKDEDIPRLAELPVWGSIRLFGTEVTEQGAATLVNKMSGTQVIHGRGGFLGIVSLSNSLEIHRVNPGSGAEKAGLIPFDKINSIDGTKLTTFDDLRVELAKRTAGTVVQIEIDRMVSVNHDYQRQLERLTIPVTLGEQ
jgi:hypothetical protein